MTRREENRSREPIRTQEKRANRGKGSKRITQSSITGKEREWGKPGEECRKGQQRAENNGQQSIIGLNITHEDTKYTRNFRRNKGKRMCGIEIQSIILDETCLEGRTEADWNVHLGGRP